MANSFFGSDYDSVQVGGGKSLPADGYICRIMKARMVKNSKGLPMVEALFDICEGEYKDFFHQKFIEAQQFNPQSEYPFNGRIRVTAVDEYGKTKKLFKGFCTAVEHSNDMTLPREDTAFLNALAGKLVGVIFGREEFETKDGKTAWATKPRWYRSVEDIENGNFDIPKDVFLEPSAPSFSSDVSALFGGAPVTEVDSFNAAEDSIPFNWG